MVLARTWFWVPINARHTIDQRRHVTEGTAGGCHAFSKGSSLDGCRMKTYRVFPSRFGWCIDADGAQVGPYRQAEMAVQLVMAQADLVRARGREAKLIVEDEDGDVRLEWTSPAGTQYFQRRLKGAARGSQLFLTI
jgi:hypothetical protein